MPSKMLANGYVMKPSPTVTFFAFDFLQFRGRSKKYVTLFGPLRSPISQMTVDDTDTP